jgi:hypothetical protein
MGEIINTNTAIETQPGGDTGALLDITQSLLADARIALNSSGVLSVPIAELSTLGAGVSSLIPALNTVTQTTSIAADGLYAIANAGVGDVLKAAKNGNFWASLKTADGASKMVQLQEAGAITATTQTAAAFNPATMMMAVALFSIEQELGEIEDMQRQIISFLEIEKESEIEADVESLMSIIRTTGTMNVLSAAIIIKSLPTRIAHAKTCLVIRRRSLSRSGKNSISSHRLV